MNTLPTKTETVTDSTNPNERFETIERAISARLPDFDVHGSQVPPPVAGWMRRTLRKNLKRLAEIKKFLEGE